MQNGLTDDTVQTLVLLWVFTWLAMFLMVARLVMRKIRHQNFDISDKITVVCMACLLARLAFIHVVLLWGSNNLPEAFRMRHKFSKTEIYQREIGSKLTIVSRTIYNTYLWLQKCVVMILYQRILCGLHQTGVIMKIYWGILAASYVIIQVVTFTDCKPIYLYWQVLPDPGNCSQAIGQLFILGGLNIFTDILLIVLPMPTLFAIRSSFGAKLRLLSIFSLGIFLVVITVIRLPFNLHHADMQVNRTTWASVESFTAAFVANIPTLYTLRKQLPNNSAANERISGVGWMEAGKKKPFAVDEINQQQVFEEKAHVLAKKSVEIQERRRGLFIPPKDDEIPGGWDRRARIRDGKVEYMGSDGEWEKERVSMDSFSMFSTKV